MGGRIQRFSAIHRKQQNPNHHFFMNLTKAPPSSTDSHGAEKKDPAQSCPFDSGLKTLREQVKNVMIPLLINIFQMKLRAQEMSRPPSRLQSKEPKIKMDELRSQLTLLDDDLKMTMGWLESARHQISKVMDEMDSEQPPHRLIRSGFSSSPSIQKSFSDAMTHKQNEGKEISLQTESEELAEKKSPSIWSRFFKS
jgi:hypothetical protein